MSDYSFGWLPDYPDMRDRSVTYMEPNDKPVIDPKEKVSVHRLWAKASAVSKKAAIKNLPKKVLDLEKYFPPVDNQEDINSCTAHAGTALVEYFENRSGGDYEKKSRLFLYKATRNLLKFEGDTGAFLRTTMKAMVLFGVPPEKYWTYEKENMNAEPTPFCYSYAQNYQAIQYYRLDTFNYEKNVDIQKEHLLEEIKRNLVKGLPLMFGFTVYSCFRHCNDGFVKYPTEKNKQLGGHAVVAVGYDDSIEITGEDGKKTKGAIRIRNSWGTKWGENGYGWLPYEYLLNGLTKDWWSIIKNEWIDNKVFE